MELCCEYNSVSDSPQKWLVVVLSTIVWAGRDNLMQIAARVSCVQTPDLIIIDTSCPDYSPVWLGPVAWLGWAGRTDPGSSPGLQQHSF